MLFGVAAEAMDNSTLELPVAFHLRHGYLRSIVSARRIMDDRWATLNNWNAVGV